MLCKAFRGSPNSGLILSLHHSLCSKFRQKHDREVKFNVSSSKQCSFYFYIISMHAAPIRVPVAARTNLKYM
jgi:hypothetical protein